MQSYSENLTDIHGNRKYRCMSLSSLGFEWRIDIQSEYDDKYEAKPVEGTNNSFDCMHGEGPRSKRHWLEGSLYPVAVECNHTHRCNHDHQEALRQRRRYDLSRLPQTSTVRLLHCYKWRSFYLDESAISKPIWWEPSLEPPTMVFMPRLQLLNE